MCEPATLMTIAAVATTVGGGATAYGQLQQGKAQNSYYNYLAGQSMLEGEAAKKRADKQAELVQDAAMYESKTHAEKVAMISGAQRAAMASAGANMSGVSAQDIAFDTMNKAQMDEFMIRRNADLKATQLVDEGRYAEWAGKTQAEQHRYAGKSAKKAGQMAAFSTLLSTAGSVAMMGAKGGFGGGAKAGGKAGVGYGTTMSSYGANNPLWLGN